MAELIDWVATVRRPIDKSQRSMAELASNRLVI